MGTDMIKTITELKTCPTINLPALAVDHYDDEMRQSLAKVYKDFLQKHGYFKIRLIANGAYGKIIIAHSGQLKDTVAIKIMIKLETKDVDNLYNEIKILKGLNHPNIIKFHQSFDTMFQLYIVMEYVQNGTLADILAKVKYLSEAKAQKIYRQLIDALEYCHNHGVVHIDIKCNNLLVNENYLLKIIDFGYARANMYDRRKFSASPCVADGYSCMEILRGSPYQPHYADIWASGIVLFEILYGTLPFSGGNNIEMIKQIYAGIEFPDEPVVSETCKQLITSVLAEYRCRIGILHIKQLQWMITQIDDIGRA